MKTIEGIKHSLKWDTRIGGFARKVTTKVGLWLLKRGRKTLKWSLGACSWCGANCGMQSTVSKKGLRCVTLDRNCTDKP